VVQTGTCRRFQCSGVMVLNATVIHVPLSDPHEKNDILELRQHELLEGKARGRVKLYEPRPP